MFILGFSGTRQGMSSSQFNRLYEFITSRKEYAGEDFHAIHGGFIGADQEFHNLMLGRADTIIVIPGYSGKNPEDMQYRANLELEETGGTDIYIEQSMPFTKRNEVIVNACSMLVACPKDKSMRGGTWNAIEHARYTGKEVEIIYP